MKKRFLPLFLIVVFSLVAFSACKGSPEFDVIIENDTEPVIGVTNNAFDTTPGQCIKAVNEEFSKANLDLADTKLSEQAKGSVKIYRSIINDDTDLLLMSFSDNNDNISLIQIKCTSDVGEYCENAPQYYQALTKCICPSFNVTGFMRTGSETFKSYDYNDLHFQYDQYNQELDKQNEQTLQFYYVTTNQSDYDNNKDLIQDLEEEMDNRNT